MLPNQLATPEHITLQHNSRPTPHTYYGLLRLRRFATRKLLATTLGRKPMRLVANQIYISNIYPAPPPALTNTRTSKERESEGRGATFN